MHEISPESVQAAQEHAKQSLEDGKSVEKVGKHLQNNDLITPEIGQHIEAAGKTIQKQSQESLEKAQELTENNSTEVFSESVQSHIDAIETHIEAVKEFQKGLQQRIDSRK